MERYRRYRPRQNPYSDRIGNPTPAMINKHQMNRTICFRRARPTLGLSRAITLEACANGGRPAYSETIAAGSTMVMPGRPGLLGILNRTRFNILVAPGHVAQLSKEKGRA